jgi:hypothetical protein
MNELSGVGKAGFSSLPQSIRRRIEQSPLIVEAQRKYLQSRAPAISNLGFALARPIQTEAVTINTGTPYEKRQDYHVIFGVKA